jgi:hypothetical protein
LPNEQIERIIGDRLSHYDRELSEYQKKISDLEIESNEVDAKIDNKITENNRAIKEDIDRYKSLISELKSRLEAVEKIATSLQDMDINTRFSTLENTSVKANDIQQIKSEMEKEMEKYISFKLQGTSISANTSTSTPRSGSSTMPPSVATSTNNNAHESQTNRAAFKLVEDYNKIPDRIPDDITNKATYVGMEKEQLASRRDVDSLPVLRAKHSGNYLVTLVADTSYLVPNKKVFFDEYAYKTAVALYDCQGYSDHYTRIELIRPALVSKTADNEWTLLYKGILKFI